MDDGTDRLCDAVFLALGVTPSPLFRDSGLMTGPDGALLVNRYPQCTTHPEIFGGGDCISLELFRKTSGETNSLTLNAMTELAISSRIAGRIPEAISLETDSPRLKRQHLPPADPMLLESLENLAACYEQSNQKSEAEALRRELAELKASVESKKPGAGETPTSPAKP